MVTPWQVATQALRYSILSSPHTGSSVAGHASQLASPRARSSLLRSHRGSRSQAVHNMPQHWQRNRSLGLPGCLYYAALKMQQDQCVLILCYGDHWAQERASPRPLVLEDASTPQPPSAPCPRSPLPHVFSTHFDPGPALAASAAGLHARRIPEMSSREAARALPALLDAILSCSSES